MRTHKSYWVGKELRDLEFHNERVDRENMEATTLKNELDLHSNRKMLNHGKSCTYTNSFDF